LATQNESWQHAKKHPDNDRAWHERHGGWNAGNGADENQRFPIRHCQILLYPNRHGPALRDGPRSPKNPEWRSVQMQTVRHHGALCEAPAR
jgi:hypothetical protein